MPRCPGGAAAAHPDSVQPDLARALGSACDLARPWVVRLPAEKLPVLAQGEVVHHGGTASEHLLALASNQAGGAVAGLHVVLRLVGVQLAALALPSSTGSTAGILSRAGESGRSRQRGSPGRANPATSTMVTANQGLYARSQRVIDRNRTDD